MFADKQLPVITMYFRGSVLTIMLLLAVAGGSGGGAGRNRDGQEAVMQQSSAGGVANLPYARGRTFASLDEYLAYLEATNPTVDLPYWRQIGPGRYQWTVRLPGSPAGQEIATREELMRRFGFSR